FKEAIKPMGHASEAIVDLKPVTFRYKKELDPKGTPEFGLIAEQVAKVAPELVTLDDQGKPFTVRYEAVNAMLLNEFLNARRGSAAEAIKVEGLEKKLTEQQKQIEALTDTLQKVSNELNLMKARPRVVANTL